MNPYPIDDYAYASRLRAVHPGEKLLFAGSTLIICLLAGSPAVAGLAFGLMSAALLGPGGLPPGAFWRFLRLPAGFVSLSLISMAVVLLPLDDPGGGPSLTVWAWRVGVTGASLAEAGRVLAVSLGCISATLFLALTTPIVDLTEQLRRWHAPALLVELMVLVYRFIFVLLETARDIQVAQDARLGYSSARRGLGSAAMLASGLHLRSQARARELFRALSARGYDGELRMLTTRPGWSSRNLLAVGLSQALLLGATLAVHLRGGP